MHFKPNSFDTVIMMGNNFGLFGRMHAQAVTDLAPGANTTLTFSWNTTGVTPCINYTIKSQANTLPCEADTTDNIFIDGKVKINIMGDINGDAKVDMKDIGIICLNYGKIHP